MLVRLYVVWGVLIVTVFAGLAASGVRIPRGSPGAGGSYGSGSSYHGYSSGGGWGFGK